MSQLIRVENLTKHFPRKSGQWGDTQGVVRAVQDVSFDIAAGEVLGLVGESGSGKTTIGRMLLRLIEPTAGHCFYDGRDIYALSKHEMRLLRRKMQIVFQDPYGAFNPRMTVAQIVGEALDLRDVSSRREKESEVAKYLEMVQLPTNIQYRYPHEFSGGQRQRLSIARALAVVPNFIVADEPLSALDVSTQAEIVNLLLDLQQRLKLTMLFVSHDLSVIRVLCDRVAVMFGGRLLELANAPALFARPLQPYTLELLAAVPVPDPHRARRAEAVAADPNAKASEEVTRQSEGCPFAGRCPRTMDICWKQMPELLDYGPRLGQREPHLAACHWVEGTIGAGVAPAATAQ